MAAAAAVVIVVVVVGDFTWKAISGSWVESFALVYVSGVYAQAYIDVEMMG